MKFIPLPRKFYQPSAEIVAPLLLGHWLIRDTPDGPCGGPIVETEAYVVGDPACHGFIGQTPRNRALFGAPGHSYVYQIYGYHFCFNAVCQPTGIAEAVLIRAIEPKFGEKFMHAQRPVAEQRNLTNGPAKLCSAMEMTRALDDVDLCNINSPVFIAKNRDAKLFREKCGPLVCTTRIGITKAAHLPLRFYLDGSAFISKRAAIKRKR